MNPLKFLFGYSNNHNSNNELSLTCESLETRQMLSTVQIFAAGYQGGEEMLLQIGDDYVQSWTVTEGTFNTYTYETPDEVQADGVRVWFTNDQYDPANGIDLNLLVDRIEIDGERFDAEDPSVFSTGTWLPEDGIVPGYRQSEYLHTDGYFQFANNTTPDSYILINARGDRGGEQFNLLVDGQNVGTYTVSTSNQQFLYNASGLVTADDVRIEYINDRYDQATGIDHNLVVDYIHIDGQTFHTESPNVFSTGTWTPEDGIVSGYRQNERIHANGYLQYSTTAPAEHGAIGFTIDSLTIDEGAGTLNVIVFRNNGSDGEVSVDIQTNFVTTDSGDHSSLSGTLVFEDGETDQQLSLTIFDDDLVELAESFSLTLSNATGGATLSNITTQNVTLNDNDENVVGIIFSDSFEGAGGSWTTDPFGTDTATTGTWAAGAPAATTTGNVDLQPGSGHTGSRALVTGLAGGSSVGTFDIDNGVTSALSPEIDLPTVDELELRFEYSFAYLDNATNDDYFSISVVSNGVVTELYDDHAHPFDQATSWQEQILDISQFAGQTIQLLVEAADLSNPSLIEAAIDDVVIEALPIGPGVIDVFSTGVNIEESTGNAEVVIRRTTGRQGIVTVDYQTFTGTAGANDFTSQSGTITFADGQHEAIVSIPINDDNIEESLESFTIEISNATGGATIGNDNIGTVTIVDNDNTTGDYLPDLVPIASTLTQQLSLDTNEIAGRTLMRFSTELANAGVGPLEIWGGTTTGSSQQVFQRIYQEDGGFRDVLAGEFVYHPQHGHIHFEAFASYDLQLLDTNGTIIASGGKTSFCLINIRQPFPNVSADAAVVHGRGGNSCGSIQGISAGYSDVYSASLDDQWIDVTNVADGTYELKITADPDNNLIETDETNNETSITITIQNGTVTSG